MTLRLTHIRKLGIATLFWFASLHSIFAQESKPCDWEKINELGLVFQDSIGPKPLLIQDENDSTAFKLNVTRIDVPYILASEYFDNCLKGLPPEFFIKLLGKANLREINPKYNSIAYELEYTMQLYTTKGEPIDPFPSSFYIQFNEKREAIFIFEIAY